MQTADPSPDAPRGTGLRPPHARPPRPRPPCRVHAAAPPARRHARGARIADCAAAVEKRACLIRTVGTAGREDAAGVWFDGWSIGRRDPRTAAIVRAEMDEWQAFVAQILADGAEQGEFDLDSPQSVAWEFVALLDGLSAHTLVSYGDPADYPTLLASPLAARLGVPVSALVDEQADSTARPKPDAHRQQEAP